MIRLILSIFIISSITISAQQSNCGATSPSVLCPIDRLLCESEISGLPIVVTNSTLPNLEYLILDYEELSDSGTGPSIIDIDQNGSFSPADYGIDTIQQLEIIPLAYDLVALQETVDDILKGSVQVLFFQVPCCNLAPEAGAICDSLTNNGITCGSDITSLSQVVSFFNDGQQNQSIPDFIDSIESLNELLQNPSLPEECGGNDMICYALGDGCVFDVIAGPAVDISFGLSDHTVSDTLYSTSSIISTASVDVGQQISYIAPDSITLKPGFEVIQSGVFCAVIESCM